MLIKKIKLQNIRSYIDEEIQFDAGSTLLAGDIGSGKSTILLAIEFAIFGIKRGTLSGDFLLRHGAREGSVELNFAVENTDIIIKRTLKRQKDSVGQSSGYAIINGIKTDLTTVELKSKILELLGYPKNLLSKSEDMIYRYTVYTPQEEMKTILFESADSRVDTIRKVFGIDKYKVINENTGIFLRNLREKRKELAGRIYDLEEKIKQKDKSENDFLILTDKLDELIPLFNDAKTKVQKNKSEMLATESEIKKLNELKKELSVNEANLRNSIERKSIAEQEIKMLNLQIAQLEKEGLGAEDDFTDKIKELEKGIELLEISSRKVMQKLSEFGAIKNSSEDAKIKIMRIDNCPMCYQKVADEHKKAIFSREDDKIKNIDAERKLHLEQQEQMQKELVLMKNNLAIFRQKDKAASLNKLKNRNYLEKKNSLAALLTAADTLDFSIKNIQERKTELTEKIKDISGVELRYSALKKEHDDLLREERRIEMQKVSVEKELEVLRRNINELMKEISIKTKAKEDLIYLGDIHTWLGEFFVNLMNTMEKNVMIHLHTQFNELFQQWFKMMIEDDAINVRLDENFSPVIEQNGYETTAENLSGGEKTSLALAYRLSLNKVINDFVGEIKTKDLIILDEPTDGFSTEQLDKLRDVLEELGLRQVIIVSHESKIESFVDKVLRIEKHNHISRVIA
ncbi:MAG: AAA family ATPase [Nanoarchaeota archaeon]|nr:AAA family ATPase [Nanoarchaeota archaeon]